MSSVLTQNNSLVKFSTPVLVSSGGARSQSSNDENASSNFIPCKRTKVDKTKHIWRWIEEMSTGGGTIEEILNTIIVPRKHKLEQKGQLWVQTALSVPATRSEVVALLDELEKRLVTQQANETGICPVREELYSQCFDELIRQITVNFKKRGLLLACVRDQIMMTINSYRNLYESSIAYGIRKAMQSDRVKLDLKQKIAVLEHECNTLSNEVDELRNRIETTRKNEESKREENNQKHHQEVEKLRNDNNQIKEQLEEFLSGQAKRRKK